ncbi:MAG TPA: OmpA family protein [Dongiaceae bacterium]|nr:OmpA family protein [Dongiaceae bacterium]
MCAVGAVLLAICQAQAADAPGSKDPEGFKRFEGSEIVHYQKSNYAAYELARADVDILKGTDFASSAVVEGSLVRLVYLVPEGHSGLEVFRNYEDALSEAGFSNSFEMAQGTIESGNYFYGQFYFQSERNARYAHEDTPFTGSKHAYYLTAEGQQNGKTVTVALLVSESNGLSWSPNGISGKSVEIKPGQVVVGLDVVTSKAIANRMVVVKAADMAASLAKDGKIDLYGIYFDVDKSDIKPDSKATLEQIAKLLTDDPSLRLEVAGHTDSSGTPEHNLKLSEARAAAVVQALTTTYGIDPSRLEAKGYGDTQPVAPNTDDAGRAKNRRVELRKI